jgi:phage shock protein PspC (stress-responsive transcriptional regulator)
LYRKSKKNNKKDMEKRLFRSRKHNSIGGVCGGLATYFNTDVVLVRIIFALGLFFSCIFPFGLIYIALWILTPLEPKEPTVEGYQPNDGLDTSNPPKEEVN